MRNDHIPRIFLSSFLMSADAFSGAVFKSKPRLRLLRIPRLGTADQDTVSRPLCVCVCVSVLSKQQTPIMLPANRSVSVADAHCFNTVFKMS